MKIKSDDEIVQAAELTLKKYDTRDPFRLARDLSIGLIPQSFKVQKGMYIVIKRQPFIIYNTNMDNVMTKTVLLHEIGHDRLHRNESNGEFYQYKYMAGRKADRMEYEANLFASIIAIPEEEIKEMVQLGYSIEEMASAFDTDPNLVAVRLSDLRRRGFNVRLPDINATFLRSH